MVSAKLRPAAKLPFFLQNIARIFDETFNGFGPSRG